jgi:hypothetical protein
MFMHREGGDKKGMEFFGLISRKRREGGIAAAATEGTGVSTDFSFYFLTRGFFLV